MVKFILPDSFLSVHLRSLTECSLTVVKAVVIFLSQMTCNVHGRICLDSLLKNPTTPKNNKGIGSLRGSCIFYFVYSRLFQECFAPLELGAFSVLTLEVKEPVNLQKQ
jgi:hypothetical protein